MSPIIALSMQYYPIVLGSLPYQRILLSTCITLLEEDVSYIVICPHARLMLLEISLESLDMDKGQCVHGVSNFTEVFHNLFSISWVSISY